MSNEMLVRRPRHHEQANSFSNSFAYNLTTFVMAFALTGVLVLVDCDSSDVADEPQPQIADVVISPDSASIAAGESVDLSAVALTASGDTVRNANLNVKWWSTDPDVFTVEDGGTAIGQNPGTAFCAIEISDDAPNVATHFKAAKRPFIGRDPAIVFVF